MQNIYISITSIFDNQDVLLQSLKSIVEQSLLPHKCFIFLCEDPNLLDKGFANKEITYPDLKKFIHDNDLFELRWVKNMGPFTKLLPLLEEKWNEDCIIVTLDDDTYYHPKLIENYVSDYHKYKCSICYRGYTLKFDKFTDIKYTNHYFQDLHLYNFSTGKGGVLYHPSFFHKTGDLIFRSDYYNSCTKTNDDIWFNFIRICNGVQCYIDWKPWQISDFSKMGLFVNFNREGNDSLIQNTIKLLIDKGFLTDC